MTNSQHVYEIRPRNDKRVVDLISDVLLFGRLGYGDPDAITKNWEILADKLSASGWSWGCSSHIDSATGRTA